MKKIFVVIFLSLLISQYGCNTCKTDDKGKFYLTTQDKLVIPYVGNEKLIFKDSIGDTMSFTGTGRVIKMISRSQYQHGCPGDIWSEEQQYVIFKGTANSFMEISVTKRADFKTVANDFYISSFLLSPIDYQFYCLRRTNSTNFYCSGTNLLTPNDSLSINNKMFYSVYVLPNDENFICDTTIIPRFFYTVSQGVVGFQTIDKKWWNLE